MGRKKTEIVGTIDMVELFRNRAGKPNAVMDPAVRQGCGVWRDKKAYDRKRTKKELRRQQTEPDRNASCPACTAASVSGSDHR